MDLPSDSIHPSIHPWIDEPWIFPNQIPSSTFVDEGITKMKITLTCGVDSGVSSRFFSTDKRSNIPYSFNGILTHNTSTCHLIVTRANFMINNLSIIIHIHFQFALIQIVMNLSIQNFAFDMTAVLWARKEFMKWISSIDNNSYYSLSIASSHFFTQLSNFLSSPEICYVMISHINLTQIMQILLSTAFIAWPTYFHQPHKW